MSILLVLPILPPPELSPNSRVHWAKRSAAANLLRNRVHAAWNNWQQDRGWPSLPLPYQGVSVRFTFTVPDHRRRDPDNYLAMMKPAIDQLVRDWILKDDSHEHLTILPVEFKFGDPQTTIEIKEIDSNAGLADG